MLALDALLAADAGWSLDMTPGVVARALTHVDNAYWIPNVRAVGYSCRTNKQSNTAFRGFGGPQGVLVMEDAIDRIARHLGRDANDVRALNFYGEGPRRDALRPEGRGEPSAALLGRGEAGQRRRAAARRRSMPSTAPTRC